MLLMSVSNTYIVFTYITKHNKTNKHTHTHTHTQRVLCQLINYKEPVKVWTNIINHTTV